MDTDIYFEQTVGGLFIVIDGSGVGGYFVYGEVDGESRLCAFLSNELFYVFCYLEERHSFFGD